MKEDLKKGELTCEFLTHNLDDVVNFWRNKRKESSPFDMDCEPIPDFVFTTPQNVEDGYYWFKIDGYLFTSCWVEVIGWTENVHCKTGSYYFEKI